MSENVKTEKLHPSTKIVNIITTSTLDRAVNLESLAKRFQDKISYNGGTAFAGFKSEEMSKKVLIFSWGGMISSGNVCKEEAESDLLLVARALEIAGIASLKGSPVVQNIVAVVDFHTQFDLMSVVDISEKIEGASVMYEPDQFPAVIVRLPTSEEPNSTIQLFASGKIVCVGLKRLESIYKIVEQIRKIMLQC